ncbi:Ig-like domain-containing protein [Martelella sp. AMO21009]
MDAIIIDKSDGSQHRQSVTGLKLDEASVVKLPVAPESVVSFEQNGNDLLIVTTAGETIVIGDFFIDFDDERSELILVDDDGIAWWGQYSGPWSDFAFAEIGADGVAPFPFAALGGLAAAGAGGLAFAGGGGDDDAATVFPVVDVQDITDDPTGNRVTVSGNSTGDYVVVSYPDENGNIVTSDPIPVDENGNWSHDIPRDNIAEGDVEVVGTVTDENGNPVEDENGNPISDSDMTNLDLTDPSVVVDIENNGQTGEVTFTFSEAVTGFDASDVSVGNGTLSNLTKVNDTTWTATVTPNATGDVTVAVGDGSYTDLAGNPGTPGSDSEAFDRTAPTVGVEITDNGQDGTLVLTFSPDTDRDSFDPTADLELENADLGTDGTWSEDADGNQVWTATITPTGNGELTATVTDGSYTDTAGNEGSEGADSETFDVDGPSVVVDIVNEGQTGTVTFTFSEPVTGFDGSDVSVGNGTLSNLRQTGPNTWTATVTPEATGDVTVAVGDGSYTDLAGNPGTPGSDSEAFDRTAPTVGVEITDNGQDGTLVLTFSPDTDRDSFDPADDLDLENADLGTDGTWSEDADGNQIWTATITPTGNGEVTATVTDGSYTDTAGNEGSEGADSETFDVDGPSVVVDIVNEGQTGTVTFTFSEPVTGFEAGDVTVGNGTLSNLTQTGPNTWTATVTPEVTGDVTVSVGNGSYTDLAGNPGTPGSDSEAFDRTAPTVGVEITDNGQDGTLVLTFSPDTDRDSFDPAADLDLENADLGTDGTWSEDADGNQVWTATITPTGNGEVTATVTDGSYTDTAGNEGSEGYDDETFDVDGPSVTVDIVNEGQTGTVTFTFSEPVTGFDGSDVTVGNGTLSNLTQTGPNTWTATVTPEATGDVTVAVGDGSYTDLAGNPGTPGSDSEVFDRTAPTVGVEITDNGQDGTLVLTFSPDTDRDSFDPAADLDLENADLGTDGTWSEDADGNQVWTATITPTGNGEVTATVTDGSYTDTAGNEGSEGADSETFDVDGPSVTVDIDIDDNGLGGDVTFTFSEDVDGFDASDISVNNGTLSNLQQVDGHTWTARVTPDKAGGDLTVTVADESYTDKVGNLGSEGADTEAFERNAPLAHEDNVSLQLAGDDFMSDENFNIAFVLDFSGSVDNTEAHQMLEAVKAAGQAFFEGTTGDVKIQLVAFSSDASSTVSFSSYADFAAQVDAWDAQRPYSSQTNYTAAIKETMESYQPIDGYDNRVFFMSDGEPTRQYETDGNGNIEHSLQSATEAAWNDFVANNQIDVQTVGIGQGVTVPRLQDVDEADGDNHVVQVANFDDLVDELLDVLKEVDVSGNVLNGADGVAGTADDDLLGIDGGRILSIDVDGETYTYDQGRIIDHNGNQVEDGSILNAETDQGGRLVFDFETGDWTYTADPDTGMGEEDFRYVLTDDSGDTSEASLKIDVQEAGATASAARMAIETDSAEDGGDAAAQSVFHAETLGLASIDEAPANDDDASGDHPAADDDIDVAELVYEDNVESLEAYLPEEKHADSAAANDSQDFSDPGTASIDLNELEDHAMMVG